MNIMTVYSSGFGNVIQNIRTTRFYGMIWNVSALQPQTLVYMKTSKTSEKMFRSKRSLFQRTGNCLNCLIACNDSHLDNLAEVEGLDASLLT